MGKTGEDGVMFRVDFAPDAVCQLERLMQQQLENDGRTG